MTDTHHNDPSEGSDTPVERYDNVDFANPERHGCVTAWLIFMLIANSIITLIYLLRATRVMQPLKISIIPMIALIIVGILNVICSIMLLQWKKIGFYGFFITSIAAFIINISIGISPLRAIIGLAGFAILYGILQIKNNGFSTWSYLK
jgi:hypothetical protein